MLQILVNIRMYEVLKKGYPKKYLLNSFTSNAIWSV